VKWLSEHVEYLQHRGTIPSYVSCCSGSLLEVLSSPLLQLARRRANFLDVALRLIDEKASLSSVVMSITTTALSALKIRGCEEPWEGFGLRWRTPWSPWTYFGLPKLFSVQAVGQTSLTNPTEAVSMADSRTASYGTCVAISTLKVG